MKWRPWAETPPNRVTIQNFPHCNPWIITGLAPNKDKGKIIWAPQVTAPMPLEALYFLMRENVQQQQIDRNILNGGTSFVTGQNIQLVTQAYFQSATLNMNHKTVTDDMLGFCTLVLSYAKIAGLKQSRNVSPKHKIPFMPRTEFNKIYAQVSSKFTIPLFQILNILACYKTDSRLRVT